MVAAVFALASCAQSFAPQESPEVKLLPATASSNYVITRFGPPSRDGDFLDLSEAFAINGSGQIIGTYATNGESHYFLFDGAKAHDLDASGVEYRGIRAFNDSGQYAGDDSGAAFLISGSKKFALGTLGGENSTVAAINRSGQIVGSSETSDGGRHAFLFHDRKMEDLGPFTGNYSFATALNDSGEIVGAWGNGTWYLNVYHQRIQRQDDDHAFLYRGGTVQDLGTLGGKTSCALAINARDEVVGNAYTADGFPHAFIYHSGKMQDLGTLGWQASTANAINASGEVVGAFGSLGYGSPLVIFGHAFLFSHGRMHDLNSLIGADGLAAAGIEGLTNAMGINDRGQIICQGRYTAGNLAAFLLTPVNPNTLAAALAVDPTAASPGWTLVALGTLGGSTSFASAINDSGQVVGAAETNQVEYLASTNGTERQRNVTHAFVYEGGKMQDVGTLGGKNSSAAAINDKGQIVGQAETTRGGEHAFLFYLGKMQDLDDHDESYSWALAINSSGCVVGRRQNANDGRPPIFLYSEGGVQDPIGAFTENDNVSSDGNVAISDAGCVVGTFYLAGETRAFLLHPEGWSEFLGFRPSANNAAGLVVGDGAIAPRLYGTEHAFLYLQGRERDLGTLGWEYSIANAVNSSGQVVGAFGPANIRSWKIHGGDHAYVYGDGRMQDLNALVGEAGLVAAGFKVLSEATGINAHGQIVGTGLDLKGHDIAFLLTPPEKKDVPAR